MPKPLSSVEANPQHAETVKLIGHTMRLLGLALQLKIGQFSSEMLAWFEQTAEILSSLAQTNFNVIRHGGDNQHILPLVLKPIPEEADGDTRQDVLEMNLFYIDRSFSQTLPLLGDHPNNDEFFVQLGQMATVVAPKALMLYQETVAERDAAVEEVAGLFDDMTASVSRLKTMADEYKDDVPPF